MNSESKAKPLYRSALVTDHNQRQAVFRLRYNVYIQEMSRGSKHVNHELQIIEEPYDQQALLYGLFNEDGACVATVRANYTSDPTMSDYLDLYGMKVPDVVLDECVISTKVMIDKDLRSLKIMSSFLNFMCHDLLHRGFRYIFCDCNDNVLGFFFHLGFKTWVKPTAHHEEYGNVNILRVDMHDLEYIKSIGSPFIATVEEYLSPPPRAEPAD